MDSGKSPFTFIYRELFRKLINNQNLYNAGKKAIIPPKPSPSQTDSSIDNILTASSEALFDKIMNTASTIFSRLKIHQHINYKLYYQSLTINTKILAIERFYAPVCSNVGEMKNSLTAELHAIEKLKLDEYVKCWQDMLDPMRVFLDLWFKHKELENDKKLLEED